MEEKKPVKVYSKVLGASIWIVPDEATIEKLKKQNIRGPFYLPEEVQKLKGSTRTHLQAVHEAKKVFGGKVVETTHGVKSPPAQTPQKQKPASPPEEQKDLFKRR